MPRATRAGPLVSRRMLLRAGAALCLGAVAASQALPVGLAEAAAKASARQQPRYRIRVFSRTTEFRHDSIPDAVAALQALGVERGFDVDWTEDPVVFADARLPTYQAIVFLLTTGDVLDEGQQAEIERYIRAGGGYVGVHSACDTEYEWPWYGQLVGAYFKQHPEIQTATV